METGSSEVEFKIYFSRVFGRVFIVCEHFVKTALRLVWWK